MKRLCLSWERTKTDTFDSYVNKMAFAYQLIQDRIEEKYAATDDRKNIILQQAEACKN